MYWRSYIDEHPEQQKAFEKAIEICDRIAINKKIYPGTDLLYQQILQSAMKREQQKMRLLYSFSAVAAVVLVLLILTFFAENDNNLKTPMTDIIVGKTLPDSVIQLVTGGKILTLSQNAEVRLVNGTISYTDSTNMEKSIGVHKEHMNKLIVPDGKRSFLYLEDGTQIWINSGTTLEFPSKFSGMTREITVAGEIFLDVTGSSRKPFIVHTANLDVQVYGTRFNVTAYEADRGITSVVLVKGKVKVRTDNNASVMMNSDERVEFRDGSISKEKVDVMAYTSWIDGIFIFDNTPITELFQKVGRYYNVSFERIESETKITGKLYLPENLDELLSSVSLLTGKKYFRDGNIIKEVQ